MKHKTRLWSVVALLVSACGGGGGGGGGGTASPPVSPPPPPPVVLTGQFKDANVEGLEFNTPNESGTTDAAGTFGYRSGETVEFSVGGVVVGSAAGQAVVTPVDLVTGGSANDPEVQNIVRFLMMLDQDENPDDGITISEAVRDMAANWAQVDFATDDLDNALVTVISDVASVDSRTATLPSALAATAHMEGTLHCLVSGFYIGTYGEGRTVIFLVDPATGIVTASYNGAAENFLSADPVTADGQRGFLATTSNGDNFEGRFDTYDQISGVWTIGSETGDFTAERHLPDDGAAYRFVGQWFRDFVSPRLNGVLIFNVDAAGDIELEAYEMNTGNFYPGSGTMSADAVELDYDNGAAAEGPIDANLFIDGTGRNPNGAPRPWFAQGCRLN
jgi:hypothetical protein